jgi:polyphosphate kinase 2 (PPK2 family)
MFAQRYIEQFLAAGEVVIFDRRWYNRAGVERVMDFIDERQPAFCEIGRGRGQLNRDLRHVVNGAPWSL